MSSWWKFWERTPPEPAVLPENWRELPDHEKFDLIGEFGCLVCSENPDFIAYEGPSGGLSTNVWCYKCGTRWNMCVMGGPQGQTAGIAELITEREKEEEFKERESE